ncbi:hypothetical protein SRB5_56640 [Streptomyces sp. RB5]|uniref:Integrin-like protein n=1 Tax=Streptomyces smaragdinus TaxID=2585196 RepID=A0A7K0CR59_9ACTN|nr:FG-GAP-like repeat-containing protein [Streptomyces smaragdinus]MQY15482.1 hypothetical protein [Streptomyces smaragdinus]
MRTSIRTTLAVATTLAVTGGFLTLATVTPAAAAPAKYADDFNGDGYRDLAVGSPLTNIGDKSSAGHVTVSLGSSAGLTTNHVSLHQNLASVPGSAEDYDWFGDVLASGDLDGDGYADLVIGAGGEDIGSVEHGMVTIMWGGRTPFTTGTTTSVPDLTQYIGYGRDLAVGDFMGDNGQELAVLTPGEVIIYPGAQLRTGSPAPIATLEPDPHFVFTESAVADINNDGKDDIAFSGGPLVTVDAASEVWLGSTNGPTRLQHMADGGDTETVLGDINGDGYDDLVTSQSGTDTALEDDPSNGAGFITVRYASATGFGAPTVIHQDTTGVPGANEPGDEWGSSLAIGDITGDGKADLVVGAEHEAVGTVADAGDVTVFKGSASGLSMTGIVRITQDSAGVPGAVETNDRFGAKVRLADYNLNGRLDLIVTASFENNASGAFWQFAGGVDGVRTETGKIFTHADFNLKPNTAFGESLLD